MEYLQHVDVHVDIDVHVEHDLDVEVLGERWNALPELVIGFN